MSALSSADPVSPHILLGMTATTGIVDAVSLLALGHVFTANMTGNVLFLGFALAGAHDVCGEAFGRSGTMPMWERIGRMCSRGVRTVSSSSWGRFTERTAGAGELKDLEQPVWEVTMKAMLISFGVGLMVGVAYALLRVKSPAPPLVALAGLLGMVWGEQLIERFLAQKGADIHVSSTQGASSGVAPTDR
jgi:XapX domain-containing protein